jgi:hypothetical protein
MYVMRFLSLFCTALALIPIVAFWMGLPRTSDFSDDLLYQQVYRWWEQGWFGISIALFFTSILTWMACKRSKAYCPPIVALICLISALIFNLGTGSV